MGLQQMVKLFAFVHRQLNQARSQDLSKGGAIRRAAGKKKF